MELTPKTRKETFLAAAAGQDVTTPTPITREEVFLDAIAKGGGGGGGSLPSVTSEDNGKVATVVDGAWGKSNVSDLITHTSAVNMFIERSGGNVYSEAIRDIHNGYQLIPIEYDGSSFSTEITPNQVKNGIANNNEMPPFRQSRFTFALLNNYVIVLQPMQVNLFSGIINFQSSIIPLDNFGMNGYVGFLILFSDEGSNYTVTLYAWQATTV